MRLLIAAAVAGGRLAAPAEAETRHLSFGYDQPKTTCYGVAADTCADALNKNGGGTLVIDQFPGAQLGQEPQMLQKTRTGDIDFIIARTANPATLSPQSGGVMSLHYVFKSEAHLQAALADPKVTEAVREMFADTLTGAQEGDPPHRGHQGAEGAGAGDGDGGRDLPGR